MKIITSKMNRAFGGISAFVGRLSVAAFLSSLSSISIVESKPLNNFLICVGVLLSLQVLEQRDKVKALGALSLAWAVVKILQWNAPVGWRYDIAFFVFLVLVYYVGQSTPSAQSAILAEHAPLPD